jgi:hypothetical protein
MLSLDTSCHLRMLDAQRKEGYAGGAICLAICNRQQHEHAMPSMLFWDCLKLSASQASLPADLYVGVYHAPHLGHLLSWATAVPWQDLLLLPHLRALQPQLG